MNILNLSFADLALWMLAAAILVVLLAGAMNRRRKFLTDLLRSHVETRVPPAGAADESVVGEKDG